MVLVPLRLELEVDGNRIRDVLTWNVNETIVTPEKFAEIYCTDLGIPSGYAPLIAESIHSQIKDYIQFLQSGASITEGHITIKASELLSIIIVILI